MRVLNVHQRAFPSPPGEVGALLDSLSSPDDLLWPGWPRGGWPPMKLDRPIGPGARGGHGPIRYRVAEHLPGRRVAFEFEQKAATRGMAGTHRFEVEPAPGGAILRHVIEAELHGWPALRWRMILRPLHDALLEDALDRAELHLTGKVARPARWSLRVRLLRAASMRGRRR